MPSSTRVAYLTLTECSPYHVREFYSTLQYYEALYVNTRKSLSYMVNIGNGVPSIMQWNS